MSHMSLYESNKNISPAESMILALGENHHWIGTHDTTMNWQAVAGGVTNVHVLSPTDNLSEWLDTAPILTSSFGRLFDGTLSKHQTTSSLITGGSVDAIVQVVKNNL